MHLSWDSSQLEWVWAFYEGKVAIRPWPGLILGEHEGELLQESGEEDEELHPGQLCPQADTSTCRKEASMREDIKPRWNHCGMSNLCVQTQDGAKQRIRSCFAQDGQKEEGESAWLTMSKGPRHSQLVRRGHPVCCAQLHRII